MQEESLASIDPGVDLRSGQHVVAGHEAIGELIGVLVHEGEHYLHVLRFGLGLDELYIPAVAVERAAGDHVYLRVNALDLVGQAWHQPPRAA